MPARHLHSRVALFYAISIFAVFYFFSSPTLASFPRPQLAFGLASAPFHFATYSFCHPCAPCHFSPGRTPKSFTPNLAHLEHNCRPVPSLLLFYSFKLLLFRSHHYPLWFPAPLNPAQNSLHLWQSAKTSPPNPLVSAPHPSRAPSPPTTI